jgi:hypothetical protein
MIAHYAVPASPITTVSGTYAGNTIALQGYIVGVRCKPATATTQYDLKITDPDGFIVFERKDLKGPLVEDTHRCHTFGINTVTVSNSTADESFLVKLAIESV